MIQNSFDFPTDFTGSFWSSFPWNFPIFPKREMAEKSAENTEESGKF
jgi:hypothetical protein